MATESEKVAASQQRHKVPAEWQIEFQDWTDDALLSLSEDARVGKNLRAYAAWELDYRLAFEVPEPLMPLLKFYGKGSALEKVLEQRMAKV